MKTIIFRNILLFASLLCLSKVVGQSVSIYSTSDIPAIQFATHDLQQAIKSKGHKVEIAPISEITNKQEHIQFVLGLIQDDVLLKNLEASGGKRPEIIATEGYAILRTRKGKRVTIWGIGADATGAMYAGLELAETINHDGIAGIKEVNSQPYIGKRGLKMNIPLDARTPSYADCGDAAQ